jgi:zinc transport system ATP-binding protein
LENRDQILVELKGITAGYSSEIALTGVHFKIRQNDFIGIIGPNGGGKTTLVKVILGLLKPMKGEVINKLKGNGKNISIGYLPQVNFIDKKFPISVNDVVLSGFMEKEKLVYKFTKEEKQSALKMMENMGISHLKRKPIGELSGGQLQRVFLARAVVSSPKLLILDEPNTYVDNRFESELYEMLKELNKTMAILIISHDVGMISTYIKTIACVNKVLHYHESNVISEKQLKDYNCPIQLITHGEVPHTVLGQHNH